MSHRRSSIVAGEPVHPGPIAQIRAPWDGEVVTEVVQVDAEGLDSAIAHASKAFETTRALAPYQRAAVLDRVVEGIGRRKEELAAAIRDEAGKPVKFAKGEVARAMNTFQFAALEVRREGGEILPLDAVVQGAGRMGLVRRVPRGPVGAISPFNFPLNLMAHKLAPAIAVGAPIVGKPPSAAPSASIILGEIILEAGYPRQAVNIVSCAARVADALVTDDRMAVVSFTGSPEVGWDMKARCGRKQIILELGGNAAAVVEPDADLDWAVPRLAVGAYAYAGQVCISVQRILVHDAIYDAFAERFRTEVSERLSWGDPRDPDCVSGPMIKQSEADRIRAWMDEAIAAKVSCVSAGERSTGTLVAPTVFEDVPTGTRVLDQEAFGPVVCLQRYGTFEEALTEVNRSRYGLQAGVFTRDIRKVFQAWDTLEVGGVIHDDYPTFRVDHMPYGGVKDSGFGREGVRDAMETFTEPRLLGLRLRD
jgi:acyl-CoA reductase-like NAD-dependent aldehyde dehydrogenase